MVVVALVVDGTCKWVVVGCAVGCLVEVLEALVADVNLVTTDCAREQSL